MFKILRYLDPGNVSYYMGPAQCVITVIHTKGIRFSYEQPPANAKAVEAAVMVNPPPSGNGKRDDEKGLSVGSYDIYTTLG